MLIAVTKENFEAEAIKTNNTVLLDFWATWCGPCKMVSPIIDEIAEEYPEITVGKVNVDEQPELANAFNIVSIPTIVVVKGGKIVNQAIGFQPKNEILELLDL